MGRRKKYTKVYKKDTFSLDERSRQRISAFARRRKRDRRGRFLPL